MIRIRCIFDDALPVNRDAIRQAQEIWRVRFAGVGEDEIVALSDRLRDPFRGRFRRVLFVAERGAGQVKGFAIVVHAPQENFVFLEYIAAAPGRTGGGVGAALYQQIREDALALGALGVFFECAPDTPGAAADPAEQEANERRLKFYETFGARPLADNRYDLPLDTGDGSPMPLLVYDDLGRGAPLPRAAARSVVRAILERKYGDLCSPDYVRRVVESFASDPVPLRAPRYFRSERQRPVERTHLRADATIALVINDRHEIHHVRDRGYVESPVRIRSILDELRKTELFVEMAPRKYPLRHIKAVHAPPFVDYLKRVCEIVPAGRSVYPYVFPIRNHARAPKELPIRAGYYCIDTFTPLNRNAYVAARRAVDCALTAADALLAGHRIAYALVRPPGHHAESTVFGGFCYFNSAAVAAHALTAHGRVAILDVDYHHGNGQQDIFYDRADVLTVSIHGHPKFAYPYFTGFEDERGRGAGEGFNVNVPLPESVDGKRYRRELERQLQRIADFDPTFLVVALGLDPAKGDPTGTWSLRPDDFEENGRLIGSLRAPTLVVQEGGYRIRTLGTNARRFFSGLHERAIHV